MGSLTSRVAFVTSAALAGCALVAPFSELAPDDVLPVIAVDSGPDSDASAPVDVVTPVDGDAEPPAPGSIRFVTMIDQGIVEPGQAAWGDIRTHPGGGFIAITSVARTVDAGGDGGVDIDVSVIRLDDDGGVRWTSSFGGAGEEDGHSVALDQANNIWISGASASDPSLFSTAANPNGRTRPFVAKLDSNGQLLHAVPIDPGSLNDGSCHGLTVSAKNEVFIGCRFDGTIALTTVDGGAQHTSANGSSDIVIARVAPSDGKIVWQKVYSGNSEEVLWDLVATPASDVVAGGWFASTTLVPTSRSRVGTEANAFAIESDGDTGLPSWIRTWGQSGANNYVRGLAVAIGPGGQVAFGGDFRGTFEFGSAGKASVTSRSAWWATLDPSKQGIETSFEAVLGASSGVRGLAIDGAGNVIATGDLSATVPPTIDGRVLAYADDARMSGFIVKANASADVLWTRSWVSNTGIVQPRRIAVAPDGTIAVFGTFSGRVDFGDGIPRTAASKGSVFFVGLAP